MPELVIKGGRVIDHDGERIADVAIDDDRIVEVGADIDTTGARVVDAGGCVVSPGFVDLHTHLREPGKEDAETIESGSRAAVLGGYTAVVAMPNTTPAIDDASVVQFVLDAGRKAVCDVHTSAAITVGRRGEALAPMAELAALGVRIFTDDGSGVQDDRLMRRAMEYAGGLGVILAQHCEIESLMAGGHMHEGEWSSRLGIPGIPAAAEELMVQRDLALVEMTGAQVHFQHMSTAGSVELIRAAKAKGLRVTAEATTHHFTLTHAEVASYDPVFKVNPPLRTDADVAAIRAGPGRRHHRRHRHRSRPPHPAGQGGAVRPGAPGHARSRDRPRRWPSPSSTSPSSASSPSCPGSPRPSPGSARPTAGPWPPVGPPTSA